MLSAVIVPLTDLPVLSAAADQELMGDYTSGPLGLTLGWTYFVIVCIVALAAPVLLIITGGGSG